MTICFNNGMPCLVETVRKQGFNQINSKIKTLLFVQYFSDLYLSLWLTIWLHYFYYYYRSDVEGRDKFTRFLPAWRSQDLHRSLKPAYLVVLVNTLHFKVCSAGSKGERRYWPKRHAASRQVWSVGGLWLAPLYTSHFFSLLTLYFISYFQSLISPIVYLPFLFSYTLLYFILSVFD